MAAITSSSLFFHHLLRPILSRAASPRHAPPILRLSSPKPLSFSLTTTARSSLQLTAETQNTEIDNLSQNEVEEAVEKDMVVKLPKRAFDNELEGEVEKDVKKAAIGKLPNRATVNLPSLSTKEKKEIASYAHSLGKKLKAQSVGKSGVTEALGIAMVESLEKNELLKIKIHNNCPAELEDAVKLLEELTGSVVVGQIGRTVILYRPSMSKLKAEEEKKKQAQRNVWRRQKAFRPFSENRGLVQKDFGRGRRGSSRFSSPS